MKVLFYISTIRGGGAARVMTNLANQFVQDGNEVTFVTNFPAEKEYPLDAKIERVNLEERESERNFFQKNFDRIFSLRKIIRRVTPDVVVSFMHENDVRAYVATRGIKVKLLLSVRFDPQNFYKKRRKAIMARFVYGHADAVVFQTPAARDWFGKIHGKAAIIYNQVAPEFFEINSSNIRKHSIVALGRLTHEKNYTLLIDAFSLIKNRVEEKLIIYGEGALDKELKKYIKDKGLEKRILLPGSVGNVPQVMSEAKAFVMSSDSEGVPNALMEALAAGVPSISTACPCGGPAMLIENGKNGLLVPVKDKERLAEAMLRILSDQQFANELGRSAKLQAENYRPERVYKQWRSFIQEVVND